MQPDVQVRVFVTHMQHPNEARDVFMCALPGHALAMTRPRYSGAALVLLLLLALTPVAVATAVAYQTCPLSIPTLDALTAGAAASRADQMLFLADATRLYQFMAPNLTVVTLSSQFSSVTALATDTAATVVVVGDAGTGTLYRFDLLTLQIRAVARIGDPSGIALRRAPNSQRLAYVTDALAHRLYVVDIDRMSTQTVAGAATAPNPGSRSFTLRAPPPLAPL